jgi:hypothetical protein
MRRFQIGFAQIAAIRLFVHLAALVGETVAFMIATVTVLLAPSRFSQHGRAVGDLHCGLGAESVKLVDGMNGAHIADGI